MGEIGRQKGLSICDDEAAGARQRRLPSHWLDVGIEFLWFLIWAEAFKGRSGPLAKSLRRGLRLDCRVLLVTRF